LHTFNSNLKYGYVMRKYRSNSNLVMVRWFFAELCHFHFENDIEFSVSVFYLPNSITHSIPIWHIDTSLECAGQVRIWSWFNDFLQSNAPFTLKMIWNFLFPFIISTKVLYIQHKFDKWIFQMNAQVKWEFGYGPITFGRDMSLSLWK
jgi:hypothetical protein